MLLRGRSPWFYVQRATARSVERETQCLSCHTAAAGFSLGLELAPRRAQRRTSSRRTALLGNAAVLPSLPDPIETSGTLDERPRAYLHTNWAQCRRPGATSVDIDLRFAAAIAATAARGIAPQRGDPGIVNALIVAPGSPDQSMLLERLSRRGDPAGMPPLASSLPDTQGINLIRSWIASLVSC